MTRLQTEFSRLYHPTPGSTDETAQLIDAQGRVRALVLELAGPADWALLSQVWAGVQADLGLPAPAIAASGTDGLQLWFSLTEPVSLAQGHAFLEALRSRYLPEVARQRVRLLPAASAQATLKVPALNEATGNWSAFVAQDLAPLFAETPWLDVPPGDDGQASLLARLASISPAQWAAARVSAAAPTAEAPTAGTGATPSPLMAATHHQDPKQFLLAVMNDAAVPLALRIDAAKALLR